MKRTRIGLEALLDGERDDRLSGASVGLLAHPASVDGNLVHALERLLQSGARVVRLFGPEHGFGGEAQDMEPVNGRGAGAHGIELVSLYGKTVESLAPTPDDLLGLDLLVVDLMDVGSRYYTFVWTAVLCLKACHAAGVKMLLCDRPNPIGGAEVEGAPQREGFDSFVGLEPVPNRHGLTVGEIVRFFGERDGIADGLEVQRIEGWSRETLFDETGLPWVSPSPNMPTLETALVYPGMCLIEATWASEGRGTTRPFELVGAPGLEPGSLARRLDRKNLPGIAFRPCSFKPSFQKHAGRVCGGVQLHVTDRRVFRPYRTGVAVLLALKAEAPDLFAWRHEPYEFVTDRPAIDLLTGGTEVREAVDAGARLDDIAAGWREGEREFVEQRRELLLY